jgi:replicative DNA helicase
MQEQHSSLTNPNDREAEAHVLAFCLRSPEALDVIVPLLRPEHFSRAINAMVYRAIAGLHAGGVRVDVVTVAGVLRDRGQLDRIGGGIDGLYRLARVAANDPVDDPIVERIEAYARIILDKAQLRALISTCQRIAIEAQGDVGPAQAFVDRAEQAIYALARPDARRGGRLLVDALRDRWAAYHAAANSGELRAGVVTGYPKLDAMLIELAPGDLTVLAGRPSMGKSALAMGISVNVASPRTVKIPDPRREGHHLDVDAPGFGVAAFSLEMPETQLIDRLSCSEARVDGQRFRASLLRDSDWSKLATAGAALSKLPIWIHDAPAASLLEIRAAVRRHQAEYNRAAMADQPARRIGLVVVDYLQLMRGRHGISNREQEIAELSRGLKVLAKELNVHVIALSQLNRAVETRSLRDKRPQLSDLRESGSLEQDADNVLLIYRPEHYFKSKLPGLAEIIVDKQRNGPTGSVWLKYTASCTRFDHCDEIEWPGSDGADDRLKAAD